MDFKKIFNKVGFALQEKSPEILLTVGVVGVVAGVVLTVKAAKESSEIDEDLKNDLMEEEANKEIAAEQSKIIEVDYKEVDSNIEIIDNKTGLIDIKKIPNDNREILTESGIITLQDYNKRKFQIITKHGKRYLVKYFKPGLVLTASLACILAAFNIISKRYAGVVAAYTLLDNSFKEYRKRVKKEVGEEKENELYYGYSKDTKKLKDGKTEVKYKLNDQAVSQYFRWFDEKSSSAWDENIDYNRTYLHTQEKAFQRQLENKGFVLLNDVLEALGYERTNEGCVVGWLKDGDGDGYISFGLLNDYNKEAVNGNNNCWLLDFNVDGVIYGKIPKQ